MSGRNLFAAILVACGLTLGSWGLAPVANAGSTGASLLKLGESAGNNVIEVNHRGHGTKIRLPIGPSYTYYDYPYYYSRGYYPTHIGGYIYYPSSSYSRSYSPKAGGRCAKWHERCVVNWGDSNEDYYGCMNYHRCD